MTNHRKFKIGDRVSYNGYNGIVTKEHDNIEGLEGCFYDVVIYTKKGGILSRLVKGDDITIYTNEKYEAFDTNIQKAHTSITTKNNKTFLMVEHDDKTIEIFSYPDNDLSIFFNSNKRDVLHNRVLNYIKYLESNYD
jgi:hypothetical protein